RLNIARALGLASSYAPATAAEAEESVDASPTTEHDETTKSDEGIDSDDVLQYSFVAFGAPAGVLPNVQVYRANGVAYASFAAYASNFTGGVHVATINNDRDETPEVVTGAGESGGPHVRVFKAYGALVDEFFAYDKASSHGVNIAVGDVDGNGDEDIVTAVGSGVSQDIIVWTEGGEELLRFSASLFPASSALEVSTVDYDDDVASEIAVMGVIDGTSRVALYDNDGKYLVDFAPYPGVSGVSVSAADLDGDVRDEILVSSLAGTNDVREFTKIGAMRGVAILSDHATVGHRVMGVDIDLDGRDDILALENIDAGMMTILSSDSKTELGSWQAPSFNTTTGPFLSAW
ncbi:MAG: VCBS repeat-containing protein, partial [Patescibacteria group bacterium]